MKGKWLKIGGGLLAGLFAAAPLAACTPGGTSGSENGGDVSGLTGTPRYSVVKESFGGLGFEWDVYDNAANVSANASAFAEESADLFGPSKIRLMLDIDKFTTSFSGGKPAYDWENADIRHLSEILTYCQNNGVDVSMGLWHTRDYGFIAEAIPTEGHPMFARVAVDLVEHFINEGGYSCIKYIIPYNEPSYFPQKSGMTDSKRYAMFTDCVNNIVSEMERREFASPLGISGPDATGLLATSWLQKSVEDFSDVIGEFQVHDYCTDTAIRGGTLFSTMKKRREAVPSKYPFWIYEAGLGSNKDEITGQQKIKTAEYAVKMSDYVLQCALGGVDGVILWNFDKKMHQSYSEGAYRDIDYGLVDSATGTRRPWFWATAALSQIMTGSRVYDGEGEDMRALYFVKEGTAYAAAANPGRADVTYEFDFPYRSGKTYLYILNEDTPFETDTNDVLLYTRVIDGCFEDKFTVNIPSGGMVIASPEELFR